MTKGELRNAIRLLVVLSFVTLFAVVAIGMVLYFRGQWMGQTDACIRELAESSKATMQIAVENRQILTELKATK